MRDATIVAVRQSNSKRVISGQNSQPAALKLIGIWNLDLLWSLVLGAWCFGTAWSLVLLSLACRMNVFVTGGAGYIGSICTEQLLQAGHTVTVYDDLSEGHRSAVDPRAHFVLGRPQ